MYQLVLNYFQNFLFDLKMRHLRLPPAYNKRELVPYAKKK